MPKLVTNTVKKPFYFILTFTDGRTDEVTIMADSYHSAVFGLPKFSEVGRYKYSYKKN